MTNNKIVLVINEIKQEKKIKKKFLIRFRSLNKFIHNKIKAKIQKKVSLSIKIQALEKVDFKENDVFNR